MGDLQRIHSDDAKIRVEMIAGDHPLIRFPFAFATKDNGERMEGQINLSVQNLEEAQTLRDSLSAFIAFHRGIRGS